MLYLVILPKVYVKKVDETILIPEKKLIILFILLVEIGKFETFSLRSFFMCLLLLLCIIEIFVFWPKTEKITYSWMNEWMNEWMYNSIKLANQLSSLFGNQKEEKWLNVDLIQILNFLSLN